MISLSGRHTEQDGGVVLGPVEHISACDHFAPFGRPAIDLAQLPRSLGIGEGRVLSRWGRSGCDAALYRTLRQALMARL